MNALIDQHYLKENQALQIALENFNESMIDYLKKRLKNRVTHAANNVPKTR